MREVLRWWRYRWCRFARARKLRQDLTAGRHNAARLIEAQNQRIAELEQKLSAQREAADLLRHALVNEKAALKDVETQLTQALGVIKVYESDAVMLWKVVARHQARIERETAEEHLGRVIAEQKLGEMTPPPDDEE